jgi:hypothetical protein
MLAAAKATVNMCCHCDATFHFYAKRQQLDIGYYETWLFVSLHSPTIASRDERRNRNKYTNPVKV